MEEDVLSSRFEVALGNLVHAALAWVSDQSTLLADPSAAMHNLSHRWNYWLTDEWLGSTRRDELLEQAQQQLEAVLGDAEGQWLLAPRSESFSEYRLTGWRDNVLSHVVIDRLFIEDDVCWIVDYKTARPTGQAKSEQALFEQEELARYTPQLMRYADIVRCMHSRPIQAALYFTATQRLVHVPIE